MSQTKWVNVAVFAPLDDLLTYSVPAELKQNLSLGQRVVVPLGRRKVIGIILEEVTRPPTISCKPIEKICEREPLLSLSQLQFLKWATDYYLCPPGEMIRTALPSYLARVREKGNGRRKTEKEGQEPESRGQESGIKRIELTSLQQKIADDIIPLPSSLFPLPFKIHLIHGITGSGKTEIYLECIQRVLAQGKEAICLVPEIGLTPQTLRRFQEYFGNQVASYHSGLSEGERLQIWRACQQGKISVLLGTRSALFAPFPHLGLVVVDEEQDSSYKQEERVRYHARDLAIVRGKIEGIPILLGSATPSVETYAKAQNGKFIYHHLPERFGGAELPKIEIIDLKEALSQPISCQTGPVLAVSPGNPRPASDEPAGWRGAPSGQATRLMDTWHRERASKFSLFSPRLLEEISINLQKKEQTLIFLNRRGFSHFILCEDCGYTPNCPNCEITLTFHRRQKKLICHYCDYILPAPESCQSCQGSHWHPVGSGTEKIEEELIKEFPHAKILRMDRDTTRRKGTHEWILEKLKNHEIDILIGTQMVTKGHDYPEVTLVGILLADLSLHYPDFRAGEQTFHLITQVAGRAGRAEKPGRVILQTFSPEDPSILASTQHQIKEFYEEEMKLRKELHYPPFSRLIVLRVQGSRQEKVKKGVEQLKKLLFSLKKKSNLAEVEILGPSPCLIEKIKNLYRWQILLKCPLSKTVPLLLREEILASHRNWLPPGLRLVVDVDPIHVV